MPKFFFFFKFTKKNNLMPKKRFLCLWIHTTLGLCWTCCLCWTQDLPNKTCELIVYWYKIYMYHICKMPATSESQENKISTFHSDLSCTRSALWRGLGRFGMYIPGLWCLMLKFWSHNLEKLAGLPISGPTLVSTEMPIIGSELAPTLRSSCSTALDSGQKISWDLIVHP